MPGSPQRFPSLRLPRQSPVHTSPVPHTCYMPPPPLILLDFITRTILGEEYRSLSSSLCSFFFFFYLIPLGPEYSIMDYRRFRKKTHPNKHKKFQITNQL
jgi:hypothetical protein